MSKVLINFATKAAETVLPKAEGAATEIFTKFINGRSVRCIKIDGKLVEAGEVMTKYINGRSVPCIRVDGKLVEITSAQAEAISKTGKWVKPATVSSPLERTPDTDTVLIGTTKKTLADVAGSKTSGSMLEGVNIEKATVRDWSDIYKSRYEGMRTGRTYPSRNLSEEKTTEYLKRIKEESDIVKVDSAEGWIYRKPSTRTDYIPSFKILPVERVSLSTNIEPDLITALDSYIAKGEVIVNGKLIKKSPIPSAYYKTAEDIQGLVGRTDPVTVYFTKNATKEQLADLKLITEQFKDVTKITSKQDPLFVSGQLEDAFWLSHAREYSPQDTYILYQRAKELNPELGKALASKICYGNQGVGKISGNSCVFELPSGLSVRCGGFRLSAGQNYTIESMIRDYEKAIGL